MKNIAKQFNRRRHPPFRCQYAHTYRAVQHILKIDAECPGVGGLVILIGHALVVRGPDGTLAQIGPVAKMIDLFFFLRGLCQTIIDLVQQVRTPSTNRGSRLGCWPHAILHATFNSLCAWTTYARRKKINSFLTRMQRDRRIRVNPDSSNTAPHGAARKKSTSELPEFFRRSIAMPPRASCRPAGAGRAKHSATGERAPPAPAG